MAILYTDNLIGNDTTGDGTIALPYKTINKAMTVGTVGDEIRVAGSGFTALAGTVTSTTNTSTTWNTSQNLTAVLFPGDIITVNDVTGFGNEKFFYKVQTVTSTQITVDGAWNRTPNVQLSFSKIATQHYYTTTANVTFENVTIPGKDNFKITGGWVNNFTEQTGWTVMNYHGPTATARSGTAFSSVTGGAAGSLYFDKFMMSHVVTGFAGSTNRWYPGTLAYVYFTSASPYGGGADTNHGYGPADLYLTNSPFCSALGGSYQNGENGVTLNFRNVWYSQTASPGVGLGSVLHNIENLNVISNFAGGYQTYAAVSGASLNINNLAIQTQGASGSVENITILGAGSNYINNDINIVGDNLSGYNLVLSTSLVSFQSIKLDSKKIEDFRLTGNGTIFTLTVPSVRVIDTEGEKQAYSNGVMFADSSTFNTGSNSLRLSPVVAGTIPVKYPIYSFFNNNTDAKTLTIVAKASSNTDAIFSLLSSKNQTGISQTPSNVNYRPQTFSLTTNWQVFTYTGINVETATRILNGYVDLCVNAVNPQYIWIDSVTIS